jgi:predicted  nucleic acid-binding Zn-ribbon protein
LPVSLSEIEASRDQQRAVYAVRIRRLETALAGSKQKAAMQLVDNSRLQMQIVTLKDEIAGLGLKLAERQNAAAVLEQTITKRFPELDREITAVKRQLQERSFELQDLTNKLARRSEEVEAANREAMSAQGELTRLREAFEKNGADRTGRRLRRASQWSLEDYRSEYDRLNLELSRLRQQLAQLQDKDAQQSGVIKGELQRLSELILVSAQPRTASSGQDRLEPIVKRAAPIERTRDRPEPWQDGKTPGEQNGAAGKDTLFAGPQRPAPGERDGDKTMPDSGAAAGLILNGSDRTSNEKAQETQDAGVAGARRSKLLREAVQDESGKPSLKNGAAAGGQKPVLNAETPSASAPASPPSERAGQSLTLLERLEEAAGEPIEADK